MSVPEIHMYGRTVYRVDDPDWDTMITKYGPIGNDADGWTAYEYDDGWYLIDIMDAGQTPDYAYSDYWNAVYDGVRTSETGFLWSHFYNLLRYHGDTDVTLLDDIKSLYHDYGIYDYEKLATMMDFLTRSYPNTTSLDEDVVLAIVRATLRNPGRFGCVAYIDDDDNLVLEEHIRY